MTTKRKTPIKAKKTVSKTGKKTLNFKVINSEAKQIKTIANKYTRGNVTALVRLAVKAFKPKAKDLVSVRPTTHK